jgi:hypothetical protein
MQTQLFSVFRLIGTPSVISTIFQKLTVNLIFNLLNTVLHYSDTVQNHIPRHAAGTHALHSPKTVVLTIDNGGKAETIEKTDNLNGTAMVAREIIICSCDLKLPSRRSELRSYHNVTRITLSVLFS